MVKILLSRYGPFSYRPAATFIIRPLLKNEWVPLKIGPLLFIDRMVSNDAASYALVEAEAAAGGGRRPAFTKA
jgi:hypothetical protein